MVSKEIQLVYRFLLNHWGNGYATEIAKLTLELGHNILQLEKIITYTHIDNIASQKVLKKIGMRFQTDGIDEDLPVKGYDFFRNKV